MTKKNKSQETQSSRNNGTSAEKSRSTKRKGISAIGELREKQRRSELNKDSNVGTTITNGKYVLFLLMVRW
jgi:hypothetical protein